MCHIYHIIHKESLLIGICYLQLSIGFFFHASFISLIWRPLLLYTILLYQPAEHHLQSQSIGEELANQFLFLWACNRPCLGTSTLTLGLRFWLWLCQGRATQRNKEPRYFNSWIFYLHISHLFLHIASIPRDRCHYSAKDLGDVGNQMVSHMQPFCKVPVRSLQRDCKLGCFKIVFKEN